MGHHIVGGKFQSDKYPDLAPDKMVISFKDPIGRVALFEYARLTEDKELASDIKERINTIQEEDNGQS